MKKERKDIDIGLLKTPEKNTRIHPDKQVNEIRRSIKKWGQYKNIVVDENYLVLAGNGLVEAMRAEGIKKVSSVIIYDLAENDKKKLMMADNKTSGMGIESLNNIEQIIHDLEGDFDIPGYDDEILRAIGASSEEISQALKNYGKASEDNLEDIDARSGVNGNFGDNDFTEEDANVSTEPDSEHKSVICPQCGAELWL